LTRVPVILHERMGDWFRQLRPRLREQPVRWFESRSLEDLEVLLTGMAFPLVLIDLGRQSGSALKDLGLLMLQAPDARTLVLDPAADPEVPGLARELGATHVVSGFVPPPVVAERIVRWVVIARRRIELAGWARTTFPETETEPWSWLSDYLGDSTERIPRPAVATSGPARATLANRRIAPPPDVLGGSRSAPRLP
jgi:hypothetical protein